MIAKVLVMTFAVGGVALAQSQTFSSCSTERSKTDGIQRIRVSTGVSEALIEKRVLPATSDLDKKLTSQVIVKTLIVKKRGGTLRRGSSRRYHAVSAQYRSCSAMAFQAIHS
jgi:hypothetical protein